MAPDLRSYVHTGLKPGTIRHYRMLTRAGTLTTPHVYGPLAETDDDTGPTVEAVSIPDDGDAVHILFDEHMSEDVPSPDAFTVKANSIIRPVKSVAQSLDTLEIAALDQDRYIVLTLDDYLIRQGETVTVSYTDPTAANDALALQDEHGNDAPSFTDVPVTNNASEVAPERPSEPTGLSALRDELDSSTVKLTWTAPALSPGRDITGYQVEYRTAEVLWTDATPDTQSTATSWTHQNVPSTGAIKYRVSAINQIATGPPSNTARTDAMAPTSPTLTATGVSLTQIDLAWTMPDDGGAGLLGYKIEISNDGTTGWTTLVENTGSLTTEYNHTGLRQDQTRHYRVTGINILGPGAASNVAHATTIRILRLPILVNGAEKVGHWGGGIVYHRHDEKGLKWEPGGVMSGAGVWRSGVSQESSGSSETWEATPFRLWRSL